MKGPTIRRRACGSARRTEKPPRSTLRGTIISSMASQAETSPGRGSLPGKKLIAAPLGHKGTQHATRYHSKCSKVDCGGGLGLVHIQRLGPRRFARGIERNLLDPRLGLTQQFLT